MHAALAEERVRAVFGRVHLQVLVVAELLARGSKQSQEHDRERIEQPQPVSPLGAADSREGHPEAVVEVFRVAKARLNLPPPSVELDQAGSWKIRAAGGETPGGCGSIPEQIAGFSTLTTIDRFLGGNGVEEGRGCL